MDISFELLADTVLSAEDDKTSVLCVGVDSFN